MDLTLLSNARSGVSTMGYPSSAITSPMTTQLVAGDGGVPHLAEEIAGVAVSYEQMEPDGCDDHWFEFKVGCNRDEVDDLVQSDTEPTQFVKFRLAHAERIAFLIRVLPTQSRSGKLRGAELHDQTQVDHWAVLRGTRRRGRESHRFSACIRGSGAFLWRNGTIEVTWRSICRQLPARWRSRLDRLAEDVRRPLWNPHPVATSPEPPPGDGLRLGPPSRLWLGNGGGGGLAVDQRSHRRPLVQCQRPRLPAGSGVALAR